MNNINKPLYIQGKHEYDFEKEYLLKEGGNQNKDEIEK